MAIYKRGYKVKQKNVKTGKLEETGEVKESSFWWCEFSYRRNRYQESTGTTRRTLALEYEKRRRLEMEQQYATCKRAEDPMDRMRTVKQVVKSYRESYDCPDHQPKAIAWVRERMAHVERLLGSCPLLDVTDDRIRAYMRMRRDEGAGNRTINMELDCLSRAIGHTWRELWPKVNKLDEPQDVGRALSSDEEGRLLGAAEKNRSPLINPFIRTALLTGMRSGEIRTLQVARIDLDNRMLQVGRAKTAAGRGRGIPMNPDLFETLSAQVRWLKETFGEPQPDWYLFPFSHTVRPVDPTRPVASVKTAWESVRTAAMVNCRLHDLRHTALSKMAEADTPESTMKALAGHMSRAMVERYSHVRIEAKRRAVESLMLAKPKIVELPTISPTVAKNRRLKVVGK